MAEIYRINPPSLIDSSQFGYSQIVTVQPNAQLIYIAGQLGEKPSGKQGSNFETQVDWSFENLSIALQEANSSIEKIVKITILVVNHNEDRLRYISKSRREFFGEHKPTSTLIPVPRLAADWMEFEIDAIALQA
ncbi:RidA family protein [Acaryochloris marina]|uniref:RidA family protein n=1 Tax=Acaryochloris marina TaxID=155978 RepID=UPI0021C3CDBC|nr:RidA family protein [Acaryochloris marina]